MGSVKLLILTLSLILSAQLASAEGSYARGALAGHCALLVDGNFNITNNGALSSDDKKLDGVATGEGGATWPIVSCPNKGSNLGTKCAAGWKVVLQNISQANCKADNSPGLCNVYMIVHQCSKL